jgi:hypothetical protein
MSMATLAVRVRAEPVRTIAAASIGAAYMGVGTAIDHPARAILIQNLTDAALMFSLNGVDDNFPLPSNGLFIFDISSNMSISQGFFLAQHDRLYVKEIGVPTTGNVYFTVFYGSET